MVPVRIARSINSSDFGKLKSRLSEVGQLSNLASSQVVNYHGGPLLTSVQVYLIFWGIEWNQSPQNGYVNQLVQFFNSMLTSSIMDLLAEYSVPGQIIGYGSVIGNQIITSSEPGGGTGQVSDAQIQTALQAWVTGGIIPQPNPNSLYFVYLPPNVTCTLGNLQSCVNFCGYHFFNNNILYSVIPFLGCSGCPPISQEVINRYTVVCIHELAEAITDPTVEGWFAANNNEIGDLCEATQSTLNGYIIQLIYSNLGQECASSVPIVNGIGGYDLSSIYDLAYPFDYNGSGKLDHLVLYRPGKQTIWILQNGGGHFNAIYSSGNGIGGYDLGSTADLSFPFDYKSNGRLDYLILYRPGLETIWILQNNNGNFSPIYSSGSGIGGYNLASAADRAFSFDYNSNGKMDHLVLYRPGVKTIWILENLNGIFSPVFQSGNGIGGYDLGSASDQVFAFDYDSSGKMDHLVLYRPGKKTIWILKNTNGSFSPVFESGNGIGGYDLGSTADRIIAFDYNGSGKSDFLLLYRPGIGTIWILKNTYGVFSPVFSSSNGIGGFNLASPEDKITVFDYLRNGKTNYLMLYRPGSGTVFILINNNGSFSPVFSSP